MHYLRPPSPRATCYRIANQARTARDMRRRKLQARPAFSYRRDKAVPSFDDRSPIVIMDGQCALCTRGARLICRLDRRGEFKIVPTHSDLARAILCHYGLNTIDPG